jgi:hypothetical protein
MIKQLISLEPQLVDQALLKELLKKSYNESGNPFVQIVNKYSKNIITDNIIIILVVILLLVLLYHMYIKKKDKSINNSEIAVDIKPKLKTKKKYDTNVRDDYVSDYYSKMPRVTMNMG